MRKIILMVLLLTLGMSIKANEVRMVYFKTHVIKSINTNFIDTKWIKLDSTKLMLDLSNKTIYINDDNNIQIYKFKKSKSHEYNNSTFYSINCYDAYNNKYKIELIYYNDNSAIVLSIINDYKINRYLIKK